MNEEEEEYDAVEYLKQHPVIVSNPRLEREARATAPTKAEIRKYVVETLWARRNSRELTTDEMELLLKTI